MYLFFVCVMACVIGSGGELSPFLRGRFMGRIFQGSFCFIVFLLCGGCLLWLFCGF